MLKVQNIIRRFCHHHSRDILYTPKPCNPLVECESKYKCIKHDTKIQQTKKPLPIEIQYYNNKILYKILIEIPK